MNIKMLETVVMAGNSACIKDSIVDLPDSEAVALIDAALAVEHVEPVATAQNTTAV